MNIFEYSASMEVCFEQFLESVGKTRKTTFFSDLSIAECYGADAIRDTYENVMKSWGDNLDFMCEWVISLNQKIWQHYESNREIANVYDKLWRKADKFCRDKFKGDKLTAYFDYID